MNPPIKYGITLLTKKGNEKMCKAEAYEEMCKEFNCYEYIPDNRKVKPYFDIEIKAKHCVEGQQYNDCYKEILKYAYTFLEKRFPDIAVCFLNASSPDYVCCSTGEHKWILSCHIVIFNYLVSKEKLKSIVIEMNKEINSDAEGLTKFYQVKDLKYVNGNEGKDAFTLFDESVYGHGKMRSAYANKTHWDTITKVMKIENRPMEIVCGTFEESVISSFIPEDAHEIPDDPVTDSDTSVESNDDKPTPIIAKSVYINTDTPNVALRKLLHYANTGFDKCYQGANHLSFTGFGYSVADAFGMDGEGIYLRFAKNYTKERWETEEAEYKRKYAYLVNNNNGKRKISSVYYDFKQWNAKLFKTTTDLWNQNQYQISVDDLSDPYRVTEIISNTLKETLILCGEHWYMLTDAQLWTQQKECSMYVVKEVRKYIDESNKRTVEQIANAEGEVKEKLIEKSKAYLKSYKDIQKPAFLTILIKLLRTKLCDDKFADKLDVMIGKLAFRNGVMDLETKVFRDGIRFDDYITDTIPYDYKPADPEKIRVLKGYLLEILNNNPEHLEYFLSIIGFSFIGIPHKEKSIYFCVDKTTTHKGDNGKSFYFDILKTLLPCYAYKTNKSFLEADNKKSHKQFVKMKGKRLVFADEFEEKGIDEERIKIVAEGSVAENEVMFGTSEEINILFKMFVLTNKCPNVKGEAVYNRYKQISYGSHFDRTGERLVKCPERLEFIANADLGDTIKEQYQQEVFGLIIDYAHKYYTNKFKLPVIPEQFKQDAQETKKQNDKFGLWFEDNCKKKEDSRVSKHELITVSGMNEKLVVEGMANLGFTYEKDLKGFEGDWKKGGWKGCAYVGEE